MLSKELMNILVPVILFILLSPGVLLQIPAGSKGYIITGQTSMVSVIVHAIVFAVVYYLLRKTFSSYY